MNKDKRRFLLILLLILFILSGCISLQRNKKETPPTAARSFSVVYPEDSLIHLPLYIAQSEKFFKDEGLSVELHKSNNYQEAVTGLLQGQYDLLLSGPELGLYLYQQKQENEVVYLGQTAVKDGSFLLSRKKEDNFAWLNVKGKVLISTETGTYQEIILEDLLRKNKIRPYLDVHLVNNLPLCLRSGVFNSGTGHYLLTDEPSASMLERNGSGFIAAYLSDQHDVQLSCVLVAVKSRVHTQNESYQNFVNAIYQALFWIDQHSPEEITEIALQYFPEQEEKTLLRGISRYKTLGLWSKTPLLSEEELLKLQKIMLDAKELNTTFPIKELIDQSLAQTAIKNREQ